MLYTHFDDTPLHYACRYGRVGLVRRLLDMGEDARAVDRLGDTPLHFAAELGIVEIMEMLVEHGADVMSVNSDNRTALHVAAEWSHLEAVKYLVGKGVPINAKDVNGVCFSFTFLQLITRTRTSRRRLPSSWSRARSSAKRASSRNSRGRRETELFDLQIRKKSK